MKKTVLLTGASGGLGKYIALALGNAGYAIALHYHTGKAAITKLARQLEEAGISHEIYAADVTSETEVQAMVAKVEKDHGSIGVLINNAGISIDGMVHKMSLEHWNKSIAVNLTGPFLCIKHVFPQMKKNGFGRIINMSSVVAFNGVAGTSAYASSKAGLSGLTKTVSKEGAPFNITMNSLALGYFDAGMLNQVSADMQAKILGSIPAGKFGHPDAITNCILHLCEDDSSYLTGQTIHINGGMF